MSERSPSFAVACTTVLDHLQREAPSVRWWVSRRFRDAEEVLGVRDPQHAARIGDRIDRSTDAEGLADAGLAVVVVPLPEPDGTVYGELGGCAPAGSDLLTAHEPLVRVLGELLTLVLAAERAQTVAAERSHALQLQAHSDELTGLPNRRGWSRVLELEQARYRDVQDRGAVVVIDLDRLKEINDEQGHVAGDEYLQLAAATLAVAVRETDVVARLGGDEFGVLVGVPAADGAAGHLVERIRETFDAAGVAASIGFASYVADGGLSATWWRADREMYLDKQQRRRRVLDRSGGGSGPCSAACVC